MCEPNTILVPYMKMFRTFSFKGGVHLESLEIIKFGFNIFFQTAGFMISLITLYFITKNNPPNRED